MLCLNSERTLELHLDFLGGGGGTEWSGVSSRSLPSLQPGQSADLSLSLVPLQTGLQVCVYCFNEPIGVNELCL